MLTFPELEKLRVEHGFTRQQIYQRAALDKSIWGRLTKAPDRCNAKTLLKIKAALDGLIAERVAA